MQYQQKWENFQFFFFFEKKKFRSSGGIAIEIEIDLLERKVMSVILQKMVKAKG